MLAWFFPGQGSQAVGMGRDAHAAVPAAREVFERADEALRFRLSRICFEGPEAELRRTEIQQPAILTASIALLRALEAEVGGKLRPAFTAGHSLGEYTALVASGALGFEEAVRLVALRGRFMQEAVPEGRGGMAAVLGAPAEVVEEVCRRAAEETGGIVTPAGYNAPDQTSIAGHREAVARACELARGAGARRTVALEVSAPFHCPLMAPAAEKLDAELAAVAFADPEPPVVTNVEAAPNGRAERIRELLRRQVTEPVRFVGMVRTLRALGVTRVIEVGPGRVLAGLVARIDRDLARANLSSASALPAAADFVREAAAR